MLGLAVRQHAQPGKQLQAPGNGIFPFLPAHSMAGACDVDRHPREVMPAVGQNGITSTVRRGHVGCRESL